MDFHAVERLTYVPYNAFTLVSKFLKKRNLPRIAFHDLRHLSATVLISFEVPLKNVSSRLGHADIRTTANIYGAALQSVDRQAADKMDEFLMNRLKK